MNERRQRPGVILYFDTLCPALARLTNEQRGELLQGIVEYAQTGAIPELDNMAGMAFDMLRPGIDRDAARYEDTRELRKYAVYCREQKKRGETPSSFEEWQQMVSNDNRRYPTTNSTPIASTTTNSASALSRYETQSQKATGASEGKGDTEGCKGEEREKPNALYAEFITALDAGDNSKALTISDRLYALGYVVDKDTRQMTPNENRRKP